MSDIRVAGRMDRTLNDLERGCLQQLEWEEGKVLPDNNLIAILCDTVRLIREVSGVFQENAAIKAQLADEARADEETHATVMRIEQENETLKTEVGRLREGLKRLQYRHTNGLDNYYRICVGCTAESNSRIKEVLPDPECKPNCWISNLIGGEE